VDVALDGSGSWLTSFGQADNDLLVFEGTNCDGRVSLRRPYP